MKKSVSGFLTHVHKAFTPDTAQDDDTEAYVLQDGQPVLLDRLQVSWGSLAGGGMERREDSRVQSPM